MKNAVIFSIPMNVAKRYGWRWRSADHSQDSARCFSSYADCAADAAQNGYTVRLDRLEARSNDVASTLRSLRPGRE